MLKPQTTRTTVARHLRYLRGQNDRREGKSCQSANGAYLNGWYMPGAGSYYVTSEEARAIAKGHRPAK